MRRIAGFCLISFVIFLTLGACSNNGGTGEAINTLNLEKEVFDKGSKILQHYYKTMREETDLPEEYNELSTWFSNKYEEDEYSSEDEEYFVSQIMLIKTNYELYNMKKGYESISGSDDGSENKKAEIEAELLETKEVFGVEFKN